MHLTTLNPTSTDASSNSRKMAHHHDCLLTVARKLFRSQRSSGIIMWRLLYMSLNINPRRHAHLSPSINDEPNLDKDKQENKNTTANEETNIDSNKQDNIENKTNKVDDSVKPNKRKLVEEINIENGAKIPKRTPVNSSCIIRGCDDQKSKAPIPKKCTNRIAGI